MVLFYSMAGPWLGHGGDSGTQKKTQRVGVKSEFWPRDFYNHESKLNPDKATGIGQFEYIGACP